MFAFDCAAILFIKFGYTHMHGLNVFFRHFYYFVDIKVLFLFLVKWTYDLTLFLKVGTFEDKFWLYDQKTKQYSKNKKHTQGRK